MSDTVALALTRNRVRNDILDCTRCELRDTALAPVPFRGPVPNRVLIVGEAPNRVSDARGRPLIGEGGRTLAQGMTDVGLDLDDMTVHNAVCCWSKDTPSAVHVKACKPNLVAVVKLVDPEWVVTLGAVAMSTIGLKLGQISKVHGRHFQAPVGPYRDRWVFPTYFPTHRHPGAPQRMLELRADLSTLRDLLHANLDYVQDRAVKIGRNGKAMY